MGSPSYTCHWCEGHVQRGCPPITVDRVLYVDASKICKDGKRDLWRGIQVTDSDRADLLRNDEGYQALVDHFNARLMIPNDEFQQLTKKGKR